MEAAVRARCEFERAALFRDQLQAVENVAEKQFVERIRPTDEDVFGLARVEGTATEACVQVFFIRGTQMVGRDFFTLDGVTGRDRRRRARQLPQAVLRVRRLRPEARRRAVRRAGGVADRRVADREARLARSTIAVAQRGVRRRMVELAAENARESLDMLRVRWLADTDKRDQALTAAAGRARPAHLPAPHRVLRQLEHPGHQPGRQHGRLHRRPAAAAGVPPLPDQDRRRRQRLRLDGRDPRPALQALGEQRAIRRSGNL